MEEVIETLKSFNAKVERLERSGFKKRFDEETPEVIAKLESPVEFENLGDGHFSIGGKINSWVPDYNEDEVDAVVLTYRALTQNNDRISLKNISEIYNQEWFPENGKEYFNNARNKVNEFLDSPAIIKFENNWIRKRQVMDIIIYGGLAHTNLEKERIFNNWMSSGMSGFFQVEFITALQFMFDYFSYFRDLNNATIEMLENSNV